MIYCMWSSVAIDLFLEVMVVVVVVVVVVITEMLTLYHCIVAGSEDSSTMSKSFILVDVEGTSPSTSQHLITTDWTLCLICQEDKTEIMTKPDQSKRHWEWVQFTRTELGQIQWTWRASRIISPGKTRWWSWHWSCNGCTRCTISSDMQAAV